MDNFEVNFENNFGDTFKEKFWDIFLDNLSNNFVDNFVDNLQPVDNDKSIPPVPDIVYCPIHVITFTLISILVTDYIQKRRGQALLFSFEYNLLPNLISK